jgi:hypothetical protein
MICISEGLTVWNEKMEAVPVLAEVLPAPENGLVRVLEDGRLEVTWKLRSGVRWHDGEPFTSSDVAFTVETINDPAYNPESTEGFDLIESVAAPDASPPSSPTGGSTRPIRTSSGGALFPASSREGPERISRSTTASP